MSKHAKADDSESVENPLVAEVPKPKAKFQESWLPHIAMAVLFVTWVVFQIPFVNGGSTPQTINVAFAGTLGLWFPYLIREQIKGDKK